MHRLEQATEKKHGVRFFVDDLDDTGRWEVITVDGESTVGTFNLRLAMIETAILNAEPLMAADFFVDAMFDEDLAEVGEWSARVAFGGEADA